MITDQLGSPSGRAMPPSPAFSVEVQRLPGAVVVAPRGEIDIATVGQLREACAASDGALVLDLRRVEFIDSSGLNFVLEEQRRADVDGLRLALVRGPQHVQRVFDVVGLNHRLRFVDDPAEALGDGRPAA
jgi:anti-sigma B factor antagonist